MQSKRFVSEKAWKQQGSFENDDFHNHRVVKTDKTVGVNVREVRTTPNSRFLVVDPNKS